MAGGAEDHLLTGVLRIGGGVEVGGLEGGQVDEVLLLGGLSGALVHGRDPTQAEQRAQVPDSAVWSGSRRTPVSCSMVRAASPRTDRGRSMTSPQIRHCACRCPSCVARW